SSQELQDISVEAPILVSRPAQLVVSGEADRREKIGEQIAILQLLGFENANGKIFFTKYLRPHFQEVEIIEPNNSFWKIEFVSCPRSDGSRIMTRRQFILTPQVNDHSAFAGQWRNDLMDF